jgi:hypothetical protein
MSRASKEDGGDAEVSVLDSSYADGWVIDSSQRASRRFACSAEGASIMRQELYTASKKGSNIPYSDVEGPPGAFEPFPNMRRRKRERIPWTSACDRPASVNLSYACGASAKD